MQTEDYAWIEVAEERPQNRTEIVLSERFDSMVAALVCVRALRRRGEKHIIIRPKARTLSEREVAELNAIGVACF
jgi:hypothetical protein